MTKSVAGTFSILRAALLASAAFGLAGSGAALARVGVTSATDGDPLGKPPAEAERILRIGIDVQANEVIRTGANDRAHLVFLDGTALTVGPNAQLTIDKFVYDPNTKIGELAINASKGVLRLVGGKISKTNPITVVTPSSTIGIRGGICVLDIKPNNTTSTFLFGNNMTVSGNGGTQNVTRPGSQVTTNAGAPPSQPTMVSQGALNGQIGQLEGTGGGGGGNQGGNQGGQQGGNAPNGQNTDRGVAGNNSGPGPGGSGPQGGNPPPQNNPNNNPLLNPGANPVNTPTRTVTTSTQTVIVSQKTLGRFLGEETYSRPPNPAVTSTSLGVQASTNNDKLIATPSDVSTTTTTTTTTTGNQSTSTRSATSTITLTLPVGTGGATGTITVPWQTSTLNDGFDVPVTQAFFGQTVTSAKGYVSPNGEFFAYLFKVNGSTVGLFGGTPTTSAGGTTGFPTAGVAAYAMGAIGNGSKLPFANSGTVGSNADITDAAAVGKLYVNYTSVLANTAGQPNAQATALQSAISIAGTGANQKSYMGVFIGSFIQDLAGTQTGGVSNITKDNGVAFSGTYNGTYRLTAAGTTALLTSAASTPLATDSGTGSNPGANAIYGTAGKDGAASGIILTPDSLTQSVTVTGGTTTVTTTRASQAGFDSGATPRQDYYSVNAATLTTTPNGVGSTANRAAQSPLNGFVGGLVEQVDRSNVVSTRTIATSDPTTLTLTTSPTTNRVSVDVNVANWATGGVSAEFKLGSTTGTDTNSSAYIDNNIYAARDRGATSIAGSAANVTSNTTMVSYNAAPVTNYALCTECSFLTFGWWSGNIAYGSASTLNPSGTDRINLATYVAGTLAISSDVNSLQSTGTYKGNMVGNVNNNGSSYIAAGSYQNVWSFGSRSGAVTATFDGTTYGSGGTNTYLTGTSAVTFGTLTAVGGTSAPIVSGGRSLSLNGAFFSGGTANPVAGQAGSFGITGTNYQAGGTFAAKKQ